MGYERNHAIVVSDCGYGDFIEQAHAKAIELGGAVTPIINGAINHVRSFAVLADGSKEGWGESEKGDQQRAELIEFLRSLYYEDFSSPISWAEVQYGDDERATCVVASSDHDRVSHANNDSVERERPNEPQRIDQLPGGCWPAVLASLTGIPHERLGRHIPAGDPATWSRDDGTWTTYHNAIVEELHAHGWTYEQLGSRIPRGFAIGIGKSPRGVDHSVIVCDGKLWFDPHPSREGCEIRCFEIVVPIAGVLARAGGG